MTESVIFAMSDAVNMALFKKDYLNQRKPNDELIVK